MLQFTLHVLKLLSGWICRPVFLSLDCQSCDVKLLPCLRGCKLELYLKDRLSCSRSLFSAWIFKNISLWISIRMTLSYPPTKKYASSEESIETSNPHTTSEMQKGSNYHLNLGLLSANDPPAPHHEPPPPPGVSINSKNFDDGRTPSFPSSIQSNIIAAALEKYESVSSSTSSSTSTK